MDIKQLDGAIFYNSKMEIDDDGDPSAYHLTDGSGIKGADFLSDAGSEGNWFGVLCDVNGNPVVQGPNDPRPGYLVSQTACEDHSKAVDDPTRYLDASKVRYISIAPEIERMGAKMGDLCIVMYKDFYVTAICGDVGPHGKYGEASPACAAALHIPNSPRNGGVDSGVSYLIFAGSTVGFPHGDFTAAAEAHFQTWGGIDKLKSLVS